MTQEPQLTQRRLSRAQIALIGVISVLVVALGSLVVRSHFQLRDTAGDFENAGFVTANVADIQSEFLRLEIESERFVHGPSNDPEPRQLHRDLLANQLRRAQIRAEGDDDLRRKLSDIQKALGQYDVQFAALLTAPTPEESEARHEALGGTLAEIEQKVKTLYYEKQLDFFDAVGAGISAQQTSQTLLLVGGGLLLAVSIGLVVSVSRSVGQDFKRAYHRVQEELSQRERAQAELQLANEELEREHAEIEALNRSLEEKVRQRTAELEVSNRELRERNRELTDARVLAATDALTGLPNHRAFHETIRKIAEETEGAGAPLSLLMLDIDGFKRINDSQGHLVGDQILREIAASLTRHVTRERAYRYGGDEFAVILPRTGRVEALRTADRIRRSVERQVRVDGRGVTISLGAAAYPDSAGSAEELIYGADAAMYWAKSAGKNRVGDWSKLIRSRDEDATPWYVGDRAVRAPDAVAALVAALTAKDPSTSAHTDRCSWYSAQLAQTLGLSEEEISTIRLASLLHDIGKIGVPDEVLFKPGPLNEEEWAEMKKHPAAALHVLREVRAITDATPAILHHHEHYDGSGYPDGLKGENIPIASRILLVTDAFDAMTSDRPYRKAMPIEHAIEELTRNKGSQFDPKIVDAFLKIIEDSGVYEPSHERDHTLSREQPSVAGGSGR